MFVYLVWFFIIIIVHGKCINETCVYGQCIENKCICDPGVKGETCNMDIIDCDKESCFNNGACIELMNGFACQCLPDFDGSRCQHRRAINDNYCKKKCFNNGKCIVINNTEKCVCLSIYFGSQCEYMRNNNTSLFSIRECSLLKYRNSHNEETCLAIGLTPLFDVHCECHYDNENKHFANCHITPTPYSAQKCSFRKAIGIAPLSTLMNSISMHVCPVNWQILDQYENAHEVVNNVHITRCQLF